MKCVHDGSPPCKRCQRIKTQGCTLTDPRVSRPGKPQGNARTEATRKRKAASELSPVLGSDHSSSRATPGHPIDSQENPISALPQATVISAIETYRKKFPVANFLHYPSLISDVSSNFQSVDPIFIASLLSLCRRFMVGDALEDEEIYADYARKHLAHRVLEAPSLFLAQSLVIISFYEWGTGRPYQAWMYSGEFPRSQPFTVF